MSKAKDIFSTPVRYGENAHGMPAYERSLEERYLQMLLTNTLANTFYSDAKDLLKEAAELHREMMQKDPVFMAQALIFARQEGYMRLQPIFGLTVLAGLQDGGTGVFARTVFAAAFAGVIQIPSDLADFMTIIDGQGRGQGGRRIKREIANFITRRVTEYWALKYNGHGRGYNLGDAIATTHPKVYNSELAKYLMGKPADLSHLPQIAAFERLKKAKKDEDIVEAIYEGRLPHDIITASISNPSVTVWKAILRQMPTFALLRHLNTFGRHGLLQDREVMKYLRERFTDAEGLKKSRILPFRFLTAYHHVMDSNVRDMLRQAVELTFSNMPTLEGRTAVLLDKSGSMNGTVNDGKTSRIGIGSVIGFGLYKKTDGDGLLWAFDQQVYDAQPSLVDSVLTQAGRVNAGGGTNCAAPIMAMIERKERVDNMIMITDEQENNRMNGVWSYGQTKGNGELMFDALTAYRKKINKDAKAFIVNIAPEQGSLAPIQDKNTFYVYGWSDQVLSYISTAAKGFGGMVERVRGIEL